MPLIEFTDKGLYCPQGQFYIDPWKPVSRAVITHAHSDHARCGSKYYLCHYLSKPILLLMGITRGAISEWIYWPRYVILIFPVYQVLLVSFGFLFRQHAFFWEFEKKMLRSMKLTFIADWFENKKGT